MIKARIPRVTATRRYASSLSHIPTVGALPFIGSSHKLFTVKAVDGRRISMLEMYYDAIYAHYKELGPVFTFGPLGLEGYG